MIEELRINYKHVFDDEFLNEMELMRRLPLATSCKNLK